jgi:taurine dioxygenase
MSIEVRLLPGALGAEVTGIDLRAPLEGEAAAAIRRVWLDRQVLVFHGQQLDAEAQRRFTEHFGELQLAFSPHRHGAKVNYLGKGIAPDGIEGSYGDGIFHFHQDGVYRERPTKVTFLYSLSVPSTGGNTQFASTYAAFAALPDDVRERCIGYDLVHAYAKPKKGDPNRVESYTHPLVVAHGETGRPLLMCDRAMSTRIVQLPEDESDALLAQLCETLERPEHVYEHHWRVGDLVMWDNLATAHARTDYDSNEPRMMQRTSIRGEKPVAYRDHTLSAR